MLLRIKVFIKTRMHSSRMRTARSLTVSPYLVVSHACPLREQPHMLPPGSSHAHPQSNHACPLSNHTCPPKATMHAPQSNHTPPGATTLLLEQPRMPPRSNHASPRATMHAPPNNQTTPGSYHGRPPVHRITNMGKNITLPQTSFSGGNNS